MNLDINRARAYQKIAVETADPGQVLLALYDAAIKFVRLAGHHIESGDYAKKGEFIGKAHRIITEFINALDHDRSPVLCENLERIYGFMIDQLTSANMTMDPTPLEPVVTQLQDLRGAWAQTIEASAPKIATGSGL